MAAPPPRPTRWRASQPTTGERTAAMIAAVMTGTTITEVIASSQTTPPSRTSTPTISHAISPRSRSHDGTAKTRASWSDPTSTNVASPPGEPAAPSSWTTRRRLFMGPSRASGTSAQRTSSESSESRSRSLRHASAMSIGGSLFLIAVGAILYFAVTATVVGIDIATVG